MFHCRHRAVQGESLKGFFVAAFNSGFDQQLLRRKLLLQQSLMEQRHLPDTNRFWSFGCDIRRDFNNRIVRQIGNRATVFDHHQMALAQVKRQRTGDIHNKLAVNADVERIG
ncbi:hypothetical protein D3C80_691040 [compost metagenome]